MPETPEIDVFVALMAEAEVGAVAELLLDGEIPRQRAGARQKQDKAADGPNDDPAHRHVAESAFRSASCSNDMGAVPPNAAGFLTAHRLPYILSISNMRERMKNDVRKRKNRPRVRSAAGHYVSAASSNSGVSSSLILSINCCFAMPLLAAISASDLPVFSSRMSSSFGTPMMADSLSGLRCFSIL